MRKLKKILIALPVMVLFVILATGMAYAESSRTGIVTGDSVNVRSTPDTSAKVVIQLSKDAKVTVLADQGDWCKISYNDATGWVFSQYLSLRDVAISIGTVNASDVNVRSKPDISSEVLTSLDKGEKVSIFEQSGDWYRIQIGEDRYGWVSKDYLAVRTSNVSRGLESEVTPPIKPDAADPKNTEPAAVPDKEKDIRQEIVDYAKQFIGVKYKYGGSTPKAFDCSGFVQYVFKHFDITLERSAADQGSHGSKISKASLKPGDLVFFDTNGGLNAIEHVGIYIGDGKFIHASSGRTNGKKVTISDLTEGFYSKSYMTARRYVQDEN